MMASPVLLVLALGTPAGAQPLAGAAAVIGDSISRGFDADSSPCTYSDQPAHSFATGDDHDGRLCVAGPDGIFSQAERLECAAGDTIARFNDAESGARMNDFPDQAALLRMQLTAHPGPYYVPVFLGHNDACTNVLDKTGNDCGGDRDPDNYCRTTGAAFERDLRAGLDELIQIPGIRVAVLALLRISELCNFRDKNACGGLFGLECRVLWQTGGVLTDVFGRGAICGSLTSDCSNQRRIDMYETLVTYNAILERVAAEYAALGPGATSASGAVKAPDVALRYVDAPFFYRFTSDDISCCDCFHPSKSGQRKLAENTWNGLTCSTDAPCCAPSDDSQASARCATLDTTSVHAGGFWANGIVCGNGIVDPGETCDDGNATGGDGCSDTCMSETGGTPTPTPIVTPATPGTPAACAGDCGHDGRVSIDELLLAVNIALGLRDIGACAAGDVDANGRITVDELIAAVQHSLSGCA
jgi:cysteine-rich repeat protein